MNKIYFMLVAFVLFHNCFGALDSFERLVFDGPVDTNCTCGLTNKSKQRIVNGVEAGANEFPFMAGILSKRHNMVFCGGTILTAYHVITAAHCPESNSNKDLAVVVGEHDLVKYAKTEQTIDVRKIVYHPKYNVKENMENDIALLVLDKKIVFNRYASVVCFPKGNINLVGQTIKVIGWGVLKTDGESPNTLRKVNLKVVPLKKCSDYYGKMIMKTSQLCSYRPQKDSCQGDSGGPLLWLDPATNRFTLVGIVSFGDQCAKRNVPGVNTDVQYFRKWILSKIEATKPGTRTCQKV